MRVHREVLIFVTVFLTAIRGSRNNQEVQQCQLPKLDASETGYYTLQQITQPVQHAEGPIWDNHTQRLLFIDMHKKRVYKLNPTTGEVTYVYIDYGTLGFIVPIQGSPDQLVVASGTDLLLVNWNSQYNCSNATYKKLITVDTDREGTVFNEGKADTRGRIWGGTKGPQMGIDSVPNKASLYRITDELIATRVISPVTISNGLAWNLEDDVFYYIDSHIHKIAAYDYDSFNGTISNRRIVFDVRKNNLSGLPDGMTIDTNGNLWIALYTGGLVINVNPRDGTLIRSIRMPVKDVTSVIFGGPLFDVLYVTTSRLDLKDSETRSQPTAGSVFAVKNLGVRGFPTNFIPMRQN